MEMKASFVSIFAQGSNPQEAGKNTNLLGADHSGKKDVKNNYCRCEISTELLIFLRILDT